MHGLIGTGLSALTLVLVMACGGGGDDDGPTEGIAVNCETAEIPSFSDVAAFEVCTNCHSSEVVGPDREGAPPMINFDVHETAEQYSEEMLFQVSTGRMPPEGSGFTLTSAEKQELYTWGQCGTPD